VLCSSGYFQVAALAEICPFPQSLSHDPGVDFLPLFFFFHHRQISCLVVPVRRLPPHSHPSRPSPLRTVSVTSPKPPGQNKYAPLLLENLRGIGMLGLILAEHFLFMKVCVCTEFSLLSPPFVRRV